MPKKILDFKIKSIYLFLRFVKYNPGSNTNHIFKRTSLCYDTGIKIKKALERSGFIFLKRNGREDQLVISPKGIMLVKLLRDLVF